MSKHVKHLYEFGPFCLDATERVLLRNGLEIVLRPKTYDVLLVLVENSGHIVEKDALMQKGWPNSYVEEANITQNISVLRKILSEGGDDHQYIETISKRGYRFTAKVKEMGGKAESVTTTAHSGSSSSAGLADVYSDGGQDDRKGHWMLVISATIKDIDKPVAEAIEAHLRKLSEDVNLTLLRIERGSVVLILEGTRVGFERISQLVESGLLIKVLGFDIEDISWGLSSKRVKLPLHTTQPNQTPFLSVNMKKATPTLTEPAFNQLLAFLSRDPEKAGIRYETIRRKLIALFHRRGAPSPEDLADITIDRVVMRIEQLKELSQEVLESYFYGVARNVYLEFGRQPSHALEMCLDGAAAEGIDEGNEGKCFQKCLLSLPSDQRDLILAYYEHPEGKLSHRRDLAKQVGISPNLLRVRISRIRRAMEKCISNCIELSSTNVQDDEKES